MTGPPSTGAKIKVGSMSVCAPKSSLKSDLEKAAYNATQVENHIFKFAILEKQHSFEAGYSVTC